MDTRQPDIEKGLIEKSSKQYQQNILDKIIEETVSVTELAEYRVLRDIFKKWAKKIMIFEETKKKIKEERHG